MYHFCKKSAAATSDKAHTKFRAWLLKLADAVCGRRDTVIVRLLTGVRNVTAAAPRGSPRPWTSPPTGR